MGTIDQHIESHEDQKIVGRDERYLPLQEATRIVEECSRQGVAVIGIDFVYIQAGKVQPRIPINSADWSAFLQEPRWQDIVAQCNAASLQVLEREEREDPEQWCSFVFFREEEWMTGNWPHGKPGIST